MDEMVSAVDNLGSALVVLAQAVEQMGMISEQIAVRFNNFFAAYEEHMGNVDGSIRNTDGEASDG